MTTFKSKFAFPFPERIFRFIIVGVVNTVFGYCAYAVLVFVHAPLWLAVSGSLVAGIVFNYLSYGTHVFRMRSPLRFTLFVGFYGLLAVLNAALLDALVEFGFSPYSAQLILVAPMAFVAFVGLNFGVFGTWASHGTMQQRSHNYDA